MHIIPDSRPNAVPTTYGACSCCKCAPLPQVPSNFPSFNKVKAYLHYYNFKMQGKFYGQVTCCLRNVYAVADWTSCYVSTCWQLDLMGATFRCLFKKSCMGAKMCCAPRNWNCTLWNFDDPESKLACFALVRTCIHTSCTPASWSAGCDEKRPWLPWCCSLLPHGHAEGECPYLNVYLCIAIECRIVHHSLGNRTLL